MDRRDVLRALGSAGVVAGLPSLISRRVFTQSVPRFEVHGSGPAIVSFDRAPQRYFDRLADRYRVIVLPNYPPADDSWQSPVPASRDSFTADSVCADVLAVADAAGADRFAWYGFSWGGVVGLQLAARTNRLSALVCGGWPPLGGQYQETLAVAEMAAVRGEGRHVVTYYRSLLQHWAERDAVSKFTCPRMAFAGRQDEFVARGHAIRIGPIVAEHLEELERMGWTVRLVEGYGHELGGRPDVVIPLIREFLDPVLLRG
jgi:dienelactone hydrolase